MINNYFERLLYHRDLITNTKLNKLNINELKSLCIVLNLNHYDDNKREVLIKTIKDYYELIEYDLHNYHNKNKTDST